jgi:L-ribulokinase
MGNDAFVIGIDFGTDSVRTVIVDTRDGNEIASAIHIYSRWKEGRFCNPSSQQFRQHPLDFLEGMEGTVKQCLAQAGPAAASAIAAISVDTTGSTPVAVDQRGIPLALLPGFEDNPNAMFVLWKDHSSVREAAEINAHVTKFDCNYLSFVGGIYSSEWFWAKLLHILRIDEKVRQACYSWVEHCDWIPFILTGGNQIQDMKRSICAAGHKALWSSSFGGLPPNHFFSSLDPLLDGFTTKLFTEVYSSDHSAGSLCSHWAARLGLSTSVLVGVGGFDAHMGAVGGQIEPYHLSKVMGTSTCDMLIAPIEDIGDRWVAGICGQVPGSILPGMMGMEAGQSAFGDCYAWFRDLISWPLLHLLPESSLIEPVKARELAKEISDKLIDELSKRAAVLPVEEGGELALDWLNGRRSPDANQLLKGTITGLQLATDAPRFFRAIVEATCFGAKAIVERFNQQGIPVHGLIGLGGVAKKSPFIMQMMADILEMPIRIHRSDQTCALGAAMFAAKIGGQYNSVEDAMGAMGPGFDKEYYPNKTYSPEYLKRFNQYKRLGSFIEKDSRYE